ncbi:MAG: zinc ribbon domain-containing protein, partial [Bacteroidetes bacterium]|nr:zinc ribbon domain-containing protein [Bacteroidota bacterium]
METDHPLPCPQCSTPCPPEARFCFRCGFQLLAAPATGCPNCGTHLPPAARYCLTCGSPTGSPPGVRPARESSPATPPTAADIEPSLRRLLPAPYVEKLMATRGCVEGERRVVTILFSDVKGSTAMAEGMDPEDVLSIMNGAFEVLIEP